MKTDTFNDLKCTFNLDLACIYENKNDIISNISKTLKYADFSFFETKSELRDYLQSLVLEQIKTPENFGNIEEQLAKYFFRDNAKISELFDYIANVFLLLALIKSRQLFLILDLMAK